MRRKPSRQISIRSRGELGMVECVVQIRVHFYSYCQELAGAASVVEEIAPGTPVERLVDSLCARFPKLAPARRSMLIAVGVDYQGADYILQEGDEVSLFPPVQGG